MSLWSKKMSENVGFAGQIGPDHVSQVVEKGFRIHGLIPQIPEVYVSYHSNSFVDSEL